MKKFIGLIVLCAVAASSTVFSSELGTMERATVNTRRLSDDERYELFQIQEEAEEEDENAGDARELRRSAGQMARQIRELGIDEETLRAAKSQVFVVYEPDAHITNSVGVHGEIVEIEDGSTFVVRSGHQYRTAHWCVGDLIYVMPNHGYIFGLIASNWDLCLYNSCTDETVDANLSIGPWMFGPESNWVTAIDAYNGLITLEDGTFMMVHSSDRYLLYDWALEDHLIIGTNDGSGRHSHPYILFNVATLAPVRATFI